MVGAITGGTRTAFVVLVGLVAVQRLGELLVSRAHERRLAARGGYEVGRGHYPPMVALHTLFLAAAPLEVVLLARPFLPPLAAAALAVLVAAQALRLWTLRTLGDRWTTRVLVLPGEPLVTHGPFRFFRHPNYLAVATEIAALPLVHTAWLTALLFSALNGILLAVRIRVEERALAEASGA